MSLRNQFARLWNDPPPGLALEFSADAVAAARWEPGALQPEQFFMRPLAGGVLKPTPLKENILEPEVLSDAVRAVLADVHRITPRKRREIALLLPDLSARIAVLQFESMPSKADEIRNLVKFRLRKTVPFDIDEAAISWQIQEHEILAAVTPGAVVRQYESLVENLDYQPGLVTVSSLAGLGLLPSPASTGGTMLLRYDGERTTILVTSDAGLRMMRVSETGDSPAAGALFHEIYSSAVYYQDTYGGRIERIWESGGGGESEDLWAQVEQELGVRPKTLGVPGATAGQARFLGIFGLLAAQAQA